MLSFLLINTALSASTDGGIQLALYEAGVDFAQGFVDGRSFDIAEPRVGGEVSCYDAVGIENLNVHIPIRTVDLRFDDGLIVVDVFFDQIHGEDMVIFAEDSDWADLCVSFETDLRYARIEDARVSLALMPWVEDDAIQLEVVNTPIVTGDIDTDIAWVPDALVLAFVEDRIFETVGEKAGEAIPGLVSEYLDSTLFTRAVGLLDVDVELVDIDVSRTALQVGMDVDVAWNGPGCDMPDADPFQGRNPQLDLDTSGGSAIGIGITENQLNRLFHTAWSDGVLCFDEGPLEGALDAVGDRLDDVVTHPAVDVTFGAPPQLRIDEDRTRLNLGGFHFSLTGEVDGQSTTIVSIDADIDAAAEIRIDHDISSFVLDLVYVDLLIQDFAADPLLSDRDGAEERLVAFIETWVMDVVAQRVGSVVLYGNLLHASDVYIRIDDIEAENGGLVMRSSLFHGDDPAVDTEAPDTEARVQRSSEEALWVEWRGDDNQNDPLAFSWRIDDGDWSPWTADATAKIPLPTPGNHMLYVRARDAWMNADSSPALVPFSVAEPTSPADKIGCMCSATTASGSGLGWLGLLPLAWIRRQRR